MKKSNLSQYAVGTPEYVVAHAEWQRSRGRGPSAPFRGTTNPRRALLLARQELAFTYYSSAFSIIDLLRDGVMEAMGGVGYHVEEIIHEMVRGAKWLHLTLEADLGGITVVASEKSDAALLWRDWNRCRLHAISGVVGPYCTPVLTMHQREAYDRAVRAREDYWRNFYDEAARKHERAHIRLEIELMTAPMMEIVDPEEWQRLNDVVSDSHDKRIVAAAEHWARLMQVELANGHQIADIADQTYDRIDYDGMSGSMWTPVIVTLARFWRHGDALRRWHNLKVQADDEGERANESGGTLNNSVLNME